MILLQITTNSRITINGQSFKVRAFGGQASKKGVLTKTSVDLEDESGKITTIEIDSPAFDGSTQLSGLVAALED